MSKKFFFEDAIREGKIHIGDHFVSTVLFKVECNVRREESGSSEIQKFAVNKGEEKLWRLAENFKMLGTPTKEELALQGTDGYENAIILMNRIASATNIMPGVFKDVQACAFSKTDYRNLGSTEVVRQICQEAERYSDKEDKRLSYWLASRFITPECVSNQIRGNYGLLIMNKGKFEQVLTYQAYVGPYIYSYPVRTEATPEPKLLIETDGVDGSINKPWRCIVK